MMFYMVTVVLRETDSADEPFVVDSTPPIAGTVYVIYMFTVVLRETDSADEPFVVDSTPPIAGIVYDDLYVYSRVT